MYSSTEEVNRKNGSFPSVVLWMSLRQKSLWLMVDVMVK